MTRALLCSLLLPVAALAHDLVPGTAQSKPVLLRGGELYTISKGVLSGTDLLFENGNILFDQAALLLPAAQHGSK